MSNYDYVIVGAGSAGCVLANRLSASGAQVLLLEAGGSDRKLAVRAPAAFASQFQTKLDWNYYSEPEPGLCHRRIYLPRGKMLGGTSSMNAMFYVRGNRADYDGWARDYGAGGWSYEEVLPHFKRHEANAELSDSFHGTEGELNVTTKRWLSPIWERFADAATGCGIERNPDYNGARQDGVGLVQTTTKDGRRWSAADAFLRPAMKRPNLEVQSRALVRRIVLERGRAVGIEYERKGRTATARAAREVIVSAGAYASPQLLMLSGIGPAGHLREVGIEPRVEAPNVGLHLQEHPMAFFNWRSKDPRTLDDADDPRNLARWLPRGGGKLSSTVGEAVIHWRSQEGLEAPDFQVYFAPVYYWEHGFHKSGAPCITLPFSLQAPQSRGRLRLRSADPAEQPRILNNMLTEQADVAAMLRGAELVRELASQPALAEVLGEQLNPGPGLSTPEQMTTWLRASCEHVYHPTSTCRIGPPDDGVVDPELRVYGVEGLRVADASVMPKITSGNTNAPTYMIAERCAELVLGGGAPRGAAAGSSGELAPSRA